jgi:hypothetical protein
MRQTDHFRLFALRTLLGKARPSEPILATVDFTGGACLHIPSVLWDAGERSWDKRQHSYAFESTNSGGIPLNERWSPG